MGKTVSIAVVVGVVLAMVASTGLAAPIARVGSSLVNAQINTGSSADGSWPAEPNFAGEPTIGLCHAYELTNNSAYKTAAENGGAYSLAYAGYNASAHSFADALFPAEAYAMARLSAIQANPSSNSWRTALVDDLDSLDASATITWYQGNADDSSAVYDVARMAVAASYAGHASQTIWRDGVITLLSDVGDEDASPIMAFGAAVWALASTGDISTDTRVVWTGVQVKDLPATLAALQAPDDSFYTKFDTTQGHGFTETTAMGTLGLMAANASSASYSYTSEIYAAVSVLKAGVSDPGGEVYWEIGNPLSGDQYFTAGETLEVIAEPFSIPGDANRDGIVDLQDFGILKANFGTAPSDWEHGDFNGDTLVGLGDFGILKANFGTRAVPVPVSVPEPATMTVLLIGAVGMTIRRRRGTA